MTSAQRRLASTLLLLAVGGVRCAPSQEASAPYAAAPPSSPESRSSADQAVALDSHTLAPQERARELRELIDSNKAIYGTDNRRDTLDEPDATRRELAESVFAVFPSGRLMDAGDSVRLPTQTLAESKTLCPGEAFRDQPVGAACTAFLVAPDLVVTAGHCLSKEDLEVWRFVLGYRMATHGPPTSISKDRVFTGKALVARSVGDLDYAVVRLDRRAPVPALELDSSDAQRGHAVFVIGHPSGIPQKIAGGAEVRRTDELDYFVATLDAFGGNSGSPVFSNANKVVGILVRGEADYRWENDCQRAVVCPTTGCVGEHVAKLSRFRGAIPAHTPNLELNNPRDGLGR